MCHSECGTLSSLSMNTEIHVCLNLQTFTGNIAMAMIYLKKILQRDEKQGIDIHVYTFCEPFAKKTHCG